jgi:hypothetical protein
MFTAFFDAIRRVRKVRKILGFKAGGVYKRIDENRELLELLTEKAPDLVASHPWVVSWIESQDGFLCELAAAVPVTEGLFVPGHPHTAPVFPRPRPSK